MLCLLCNIIACPVQLLLCRSDRPRFACAASFRANHFTVIRYTYCKAVSRIPDIPVARRRFFRNALSFHISEPSKAGSFFRKCVSAYRFTVKVGGCIRKGFAGNILSMPLLERLQLYAYSKKLSRSARNSASSQCFHVK